MENRKNKRKIILLAVLIVACIIYTVYNVRENIYKTKRFFHAHQARLKSGRIGEKITYNVLMGKIKLGEAVFRHLPNAQLDGKEVNLMAFETKAVGFRDLEEIFSDKETFLPLRIKRRIYIWGSREEIQEDYDQKNFILTIRKVKEQKKTQTIIRKDSAINNAVLLPFYVRDIAKFDMGWSLKANLPGAEFKIKLAAKEEVRVPAGRFQAYRLKSEPKKFEIWISADERKIPLKIKGASGLGYILTMREYVKSDSLLN